MAEPPTCCQTGDPAIIDATSEGAASTLVGSGPLYAQLLGLGILMISVHCAGMCGPIVLSLRFGVQRDWRRGRAALALGQLAAYQGGRAVVYGLLGAGVGALGSLAADGPWGAWLGEGFATQIGHAEFAENIVENGGRVADRVVALNVPGRLKAGEHIGVDKLLERDAVLKPD